MNHNCGRSLNYKRSCLLVGQCFFFKLEIFLNISTWSNGIDRDLILTRQFVGETTLYDHGNVRKRNYWISPHFQSHFIVYKFYRSCDSGPFLVGRENRSNFFDVYASRHFIPLQLYLTKLLFLFELLFFLIRDGVQIQSPSVTIVGFLTETRISDVIVRTEVRIVAWETRQN